MRSYRNLSDTVSELTNGVDKLDDEQQNFSSRRIRLVAYGASLESWLGASPHGFESHILR